MDKPFMPLANIDFADALNEAHADTATGQSLLNKYRQVMLTKEATCGLVNSFVKEARNLTYDRGVSQLLEDICYIINDNPVSWQLATACENINANNSQYNYLNRNAARQVNKLLEMDEKDVVTYIKNGALKNVMFCEAFRQIVKNVFRDNRTFVTEDYVAQTPVSYVEMNEDHVYFEVLGKIYNIHEDQITEATANEVSAEFLEISRLLESQFTKFEGDNLVVTLPNATYTITENENGITCVREGRSKMPDEKGDCTIFENAEALREHNRLVIGATTPNQRNQTAAILEGVAKCMEGFNNFMSLNNVQIIESKKDRFIVIEHQDHMYASSICSNHTNSWKVNSNVVEALSFIKEKTHLDIKKDYAENIEEAFNKRAQKEQQQIKENLEKEEIDARRRKIETLMEQYKGDEVKLAVLAKVASELNSL